MPCAFDVGAWGPRSTRYTVPTEAVDVSLCLALQGLSSLQAVLDKCVEVVQGFFELLKPQDVKRYRSQDLKDPMLR